MQKIAITGLIASGKSTISRYLQRRGFEVADADAIVNDLYQTSEIKDIMQSRFGWEIFLPDGEIDKRKLAQLAADEREIKSFLERVFWPRVAQEVQMWLFAQEKKGQKIVWVNVPLLFEAKMNGFFDEIWLVEADEELRLERLQQREHLSRQEAQKRLQMRQKALYPLEKISRVIVNNELISDLERQVEAVLPQI
ncbi:dephospho-CoA kinase [bacterium]|nr:dephospho-CoA kinase [bacterium]MBQ6436564.1 dephospho-CoA kinase [bacterium]